FERGRWADPQTWIRLWRIVRWMRQQSFDWVIDLQSLARSGLLAWLANGALTIGLDEAREGARGFFDIIVRTPSAQYHALDWNLAVLPHLGVPINWDFEWLPLRASAAATLRQKLPAGDFMWIALQPGAR